MTRNERTMVVSLVIALAIGVGATVGYLFSHKGETPTPTLNVPPTITVATGPSVLNAVQSEAKLETVVMNLAQDTTVARIHGPMDVCSEKVTYLAYFNVAAGVDLAKIDSSRIKVTNDGFPDKAKVTITMPPTEILHVALDTKDSRVVSQESPQWIPGCTHQIADMTVEAQRRLQRSAEGSAIERGILQLAEDKAAFALKRLLLDVGYKDVTIRFPDQIRAVGTSANADTATGSTGVTTGNGAANMGASSSVSGTGSGTGAGDTGGQPLPPDTMQVAPAAPESILPPKKKPAKVGKPKAKPANRNADPVVTVPPMLH